MLNALYRKLIHPKVLQKMERMSRGIPKTDLHPQHLKNAQLLENRERMLKLLPKGGVVAELGVNKGDFSQKILDINKPEKFHLVDFWGSARYNLEIRKGVENRFSSELESGKMEINLGLSTEVVSQFEDEYFDWIYIDTAHTYEVTRDELEYYRTKVKKGGIIAGHDYILGNWDGMIRYGVVEAVHEFCQKHQWQIRYLTVEQSDAPSFAIQKME